MPFSGGAVVAPPGRLAVKAVIKPGLVTIGLLIIAALLAAMPLAAQAQEPPPQIFVGTARVNGFPVAATIPITAWVDNRQVGETVTQSEGEFVLQVSGGEGTLSFRIGELTADQRVPWVLGGLTRGFVLTANDATDPCFTIPIENNFTANLKVSSLCRGVGAGWAISELLGDKFTRAFHFDNNAKQWLFYDPLAGDDNTLASFISGHAYFILVSESVSVTLDGKYHNLSCVAGNCWNLIVW